MKYLFFSFCLSLLAFLATPGSSHSSDDEATGGDWSLLYYASAHDTPGHLLVVEKAQQRLTLYALKNGLETVLRLPCATGTNGGHKLASGDAKTPEGIYFITEIYEDKKITIFGSRAFHLDYPNVFDRQAGRRGNGIFIHGTNKKLIPYSTNGCITLDNHDLDALAPYLTVQTLPILIVDSLADPAGAKEMVMGLNDDRFHTVLREIGLHGEEIASDAIRRLYFLRLGGQALACLSYSELDGGLLQYRHQKRSYLTAGISRQWLTLQSTQQQEGLPLLLAQLPKKEHLRPVAARHTAALPVPQPMAQAAALAAVQPAPVAILPQVPPPAPQIHVQGEKTEPAQLARKPSESGPRPGTSPTRQARPASEPRAEILAFVEKWRQAWAGKDIETYLACYAPSFTSAGLDLAGWREKKTQLNTLYRYIRVDLENPRITLRNGAAIVSFTQHYQSDKYRSTGRKTLHLVHNGHGWKIHREMM